MIIDRVLSVSKKVIRLTDERWIHITDNHTEIAGLKQEVLSTIYQPDFVARGVSGELYAVKYFNTLENHIVAIYKEDKTDGFIITAFRARKIEPYLRKEIVWKKN
ncbi:MAG: hypothetical protein UT63_C0109G0005 [Candidatus Gottesmanbacteria bacterium GW2011_GWC2_39_8]|uniref:Phage-Barnase-EndoU-ColicinE5/D-RelE like nuclease 2 domain-containing protein n=1 Tax=Candidatus Gottesmanbacteria bacterium GW2011_GWC2_39_8 TaxID=1618450 RepID=A0A0G0SWJ9_9BACT|nr:MAG: hypothetical protein UT63_C0109G0005 [Candidatus Gottesmanbacteria bacterium GW2011_GWC2_39_8]